jgi:two-component system OmpR family sensor kinase
VSIRARLVVVMLVVVTAGLGVANVATYSALRSFLTDRLDQQLVAAQYPVASELVGRAGGGGFHPRERDRSSQTLSQIPPGTYGELRTADGAVVAQVLFGFSEEDLAPPPGLPAALPGSGSPSPEPQYFTADATGGSSVRYRVLAARTTEPSGTLVVALPLRDVSQTLARLVRIQVVVSVAVLAVLGALAWRLVRLGLRPLSEMERTADAIAAGNLSERVPSTDPRTEVGRVGSAFNAMLARIEGAFAERQESEDRLRRFVADASHELRTPLTSIRGYAELFRRGAGQRPDDLAKAMRRIEEEATRMSGLVDDLLLLARLDEDEGASLDPHPLDLARLAADGVDDARAVDPQRPFILERPPGPVTVVADEARLRQVVANLLANARTHTPGGTPVRVAVGSEDGRAWLEVADEGPGLSPGDEDKVFDRFFRADKSRSRASGGAGLGLSIVAAVTAAHAGQVRVDNRPGQGVTFRVELPAVPVPSEEDPT